MHDGSEAYRRFLDGEQDAFDEILALYLDRLTFFLYRYVQNLHDAEDLAIDTLLVLLTDRRRYRFDRPLKPYLFTVARNKALNFLRHRDRFAAVSPEDAEAELADRSSLEDELIADEQSKQLNAALETLPEDMRLAVQLVYFEQLSYAETAKILNKTQKQVDNLLYRAKFTLRQILTEGELSLKDESFKR